MSSSSRIPRKDSEAALTKMLVAFAFSMASVKATLLTLSSVVTGEEGRGEGRKYR